MFVELWGCKGHPSYPSSSSCRKRSGSSSSVLMKSRRWLDVSFCILPWRCGGKLAGSSMALRLMSRRVGLVDGTKKISDAEDTLDGSNGFSFCSARGAIIVIHVLKRSVKGNGCGLHFLYNIRENRSQSTQQWQYIFKKPNLTDRLQLTHLYKRQEWAIEHGGKRCGEGLFEPRANVAGAHVHFQRCPRLFGWRGARDGQSTRQGMGSQPCQYK